MCRLLGWCRDNTNLLSNTNTTTRSTFKLHTSWSHYFILLLSPFHRPLQSTQYPSTVHNPHYLWQHSKSTYEVKLCTVLWSSLIDKEHSYIAACQLNHTINAQTQIERHLSISWTSWYIGRKSIQDKKKKMFQIVPCNDCHDNVYCNISTNGDLNTTNCAPWALDLVKPLLKKVAPRMKYSSQINVNQNIMP